MFHPDGGYRRRHRMGSNEFHSNSFITVTVVTVFPWRRVVQALTRSAIWKASVAGHVDVVAPGQKVRRVRTPGGPMW